MWVSYSPIHITSISTSARKKHMNANKYMFMPHKTKLQFIGCLHKADSEQQPRRSECHSSCLCDPPSDIKSRPDETGEAYLRGHMKLILEIYQSKHARRHFCV